MTPPLKWLKSLKMGLETSSLHQMKALSEQISKMAQDWVSFIKEVQKMWKMHHMNAPSA